VIIILVIRTSAEKKWFCLEIVTSLLDYVHFSACITGGLSSCVHFQIPKKETFLQSSVLTHIENKVSSISCYAFFLLGYDTFIEILIFE